MRRSLAPSLRQNEAVSKTNNYLIPIKVKVNISNQQVSSTTSINENVNHSNKLASFNVVYGKLSTKKHKTWESDGRLMVSENMLILKELNGNVIDRIPKENNISFEEGTRIIMNSREIELIDKINENDISNEITTTSSKRKTDKIEENSFSFCRMKKKFCTPKTISVSIKEEIPTFEPLKLPNPDANHQWKHNKMKLPLTDVFIPSSLAKILRPHQRDGVQFLYECLMGFRFNEKGEYCGAILADEMGLGKTIQCITLCCTFLKTGPYGGVPIASKILIVTPSSLVENWDREILKWLKHERYFTYIITGKHKSNKIPNHIPFVLVSYETLSSQFDSIKSIKFDVLVCDEGHRLKNSSIKISKQLSQLNCSKRIILSGTPIQNDLQEFYSLINFVNPGILGEYTEYKKYYETPIVQSQQSNVLSMYRELGEERAKELNKIIQAFVLRRTSDVINSYLPKKQEIVLFVKPTDLQCFMLKSTLEYYENRIENVTPFEIITVLKKICNHPSLLLKINADNSNLLKYLKSILPPWNEIGPYDSSKLSTIVTLLKNLEESKEKIILISYYTKTLDMLQNLCSHLNYNYCRLDGSTPSNERNKIVEQFNKPDSNIFVFLLSAKASGVGLNLIGASRLVLYDNDWNPASDLQAMSRIWRDGQKRNVFIYRLITAGTIEEKIYQRQISKTSLSDCVVDASNISNNIKLSDDDLKELFTIEFIDMEKCLTHEMIECKCPANGEVPVTRLDEDIENKEQETNLFQIELNNYSFTKQQNTKMNELMKWEHHTQPIAENVLKDISLTDEDGEILFLFRNQVEFQV